jgi:acyl carrier protein
MHDDTMRPIGFSLNQRPLVLGIQVIMKTATPTNTYNELKDLIMDTLLVDPDDVQPTSRLIDDLGADAVEAADLFQQIEREWGVEITPEVIRGFKTVQDVVDHIDESIGNE